MIISKADILQEIDDKIAICDKHLDLNPYQDAYNRVLKLMLNPCKGGIHSNQTPFYLNAIYNKEQEIPVPKNELPSINSIKNITLQELKTKYQYLPSYIIIREIKELSVDGVRINYSDTYLNTSMYSWKTPQDAFNALLSLKQNQFKNLSYTLPTDYNPNKPQSQPNLILMTQGTQKPYTKEVNVTYSFQIATDLSYLLSAVIAEKNKEIGAEVKSKYNIKNNNIPQFLYKTYKVSLLINIFPPINTNNVLFNNYINGNMIYDFTYFFNNHKNDFSIELELKDFKLSINKTINSVFKISEELLNIDLKDRELAYYKQRLKILELFNLIYSYERQIKTMNMDETNPNRSIYEWGLLYPYIVNRENSFHPKFVQNEILKRRSELEYLLKNNVTYEDALKNDKEEQRLRQLINALEHSLTDEPSTYTNCGTAFIHELNKLILYKKSILLKQYQEKKQHFEELLSFDITLYYEPSFWNTYYGFKSLAWSYTKEDIDKKLLEEVKKENLEASKRNEDKVNELNLKKAEQQKYILIYYSNLNQKNNIRQKQTELNQAVLDMQIQYEEIKKLLTEIDKKIEEVKNDESKQLLYAELIRQQYYYTNLQGTFNIKISLLQKLYTYNLSEIQRLQQLLKLKQQDLKELALTEKELEKYQTPDIHLTYTVDEEGVQTSKGYTFSPNGLYKNLYIDTQPNNEWYDLKKELEDFRIDCLWYLPDEFDDGTKNELNFADPTSQQYMNFFNNKNNKPGKCSWFIPMNTIFSLFDLDSLTPVSILAFLFANVDVYVKNEYGQQVWEEQEQEVEELEKGKLVKKIIKIQVPKKESRHIAVQDGYSYIDTGLVITMLYTGIPTLPNNTILIPGVGPLYGALMAGFYNAVTPLNIKKLHKYPYQNNIPGGRYFWVQTFGGMSNMLTKQAWNILSPSFYEDVATGIPIETSFSIYIRQPVECGFPRRCGIMTAEEIKGNGKCGLEEVWEKAIDLDINDDDSFDFNAYMEYMKSLSGKYQDAITNSLTPLASMSTSDLLKGASNLINNVDKRMDQVIRLYLKNIGPISDAAAHLLDNKRVIAEWANGTISLVSNVWNTTDAIIQLNRQQEYVENLFLEIGEAYLNELVDLIPPECRKYYCESIRSAKQKDINELMAKMLNDKKTAQAIIDEGKATSFWTAAAEVLGLTKENGEAFLNGLGEMFGFGENSLVRSMYKLAVGSAERVIDDVRHARVFKICPKRRGLYLKEINPLNPENAFEQLADGSYKVPLQIDILNQFNMIISLKIVNNLLKAMNNCITKSMVKHNINASKLFPDEMRYFLEAANSVGDISLMARELKRRGLTLDSLFKLAGVSAGLDHYLNVDVLNISLGRVYDLLYSRGLDLIINVDNLLQKEQIIQSLHDTVNSAVSNNLDIIEKIKNGAVLNINDQYKSITADNMLQKTKLWAKTFDLDINNVTTIALNAKDLVEDPFKDPRMTFKRVNNIISTIGNDVMKKLMKLQELKKNDSNLLLKKIQLYLEDKKKLYDIEKWKEVKNSSIVSQGNANK